MKRFLRCFLEGDEPEFIQQPGDGLFDRMCFTQHMELLSQIIRRAGQLTPQHLLPVLAIRITQGIQFLLADLAAELAQCEAWLWHVGRMVDGGAQDFGIEASMLKMRASDLAMRIATEAVQLHGGYGYCKDYRVERLMRDAKITQIWEGTNQIHRQLIGRSFLRR